MEHTLKGVGLALGSMGLLSGCQSLPWQSEPSAEDLPPVLNIAAASTEPAPPAIEPQPGPTAPAIPLVPPVTQNLEIPEAAPLAPDALAPVLPHHPIAPEPPVVVDPPSDQAGTPVPAGSVTRNQTDLLFYQAGQTEPFTGSATLLHADGSRQFDGSFVNGRREGEGMEWDANGNLRYEGVFKADRLFEGYAFWYYVDSGALKMRADYAQGRLVRGYHWDRNGKVFK